MCDMFMYNWITKIYIYIFSALLMSWS